MAACEFHKPDKQSFLLNKSLHFLYISKVLKDTIFRCNFQHDSGVTCTPFSATPSDAKGNYIMYASATSGDRPNNSKFSPCSIANVTMVLDAVFQERFGKENCFKEREEAFCGNNIVEMDGENPEECDCGYMEDCKDQCCYGRGDVNPCKLRAGKQCR